MKVRFYATLRQAVGGAAVEVPWQEGMTVADMLDRVIARHPALGPQLFDDDGQLFRHVHVMVNGRDAPYLNGGLDTPLGADDTLDIFPPVGGGSYNTESQGPIPSWQRPSAHRQEETG